MNLYMRILETRLRQMMEPGIFVGVNREVLFYTREWKQGWVAELQRRGITSANRERKHSAKKTIPVTGTVFIVGLVAEALNC